MIDNRHGYREAFATILRTAADLAPGTPVDINYTDDPKEEVAYGLLTPNILADVGSGSVGTICGEAVAGPGNTVIPADRVLPQVRNAQPMRIHASAPEMKAFLSCATKIVTDPRTSSTFIDLPGFEQTLPELVNRANNALVAVAGERVGGNQGGSGGERATDTAGSKALTTEVQPPFFALLHQVMRSMIEERTR